jgi:hypothetical protein
MAETIFKIPKLKGSENYDIWSLRLESIIIEKGYYDYIIADYSSSISYTEAINSNNNTKVVELEEIANKATALIKLSLEDGPLLQTRFIKNPYTLYTTLKNLYCAQGFSSEFILSKELINTTINSFKGNLELYINSFKRIINNLEAKGISLPSNFVAALLLNNLNKDYEYIVTIITQTIRVNNSTINIDSIIAQLLDESRRLNSIKPKNNYNTNSYRSYYNSNKSYNNNKNNSYPNNIEMSIQTKSKSNSNTSNTSNTKYKTNKNCNYCNKKGHLEASCYKKNPSLHPNNRKSINSSSSSTIRDNNNNLEEYNLESTLVSSIVSKVNNSNNNYINFILDSGATIHTCSNKYLFTNIKPTNTSIKWGNTSNIIKASGIGNIDVIFTSTNKKVTISNVLYIPELGVNLLSLSLIINKNFSLSFNKENYYIYTPSKSLLAIGSYKDKVTIFSVKSSKNISLKDSNKPLATLSTFNSSNLNIDTSNLEELDSNSITDESDLELIDSRDLVIEKAIDLDSNSNSNSNSNSISKTISKFRNKEELVVNNNNIELVHARLGHINLKAIKKLIDNTKGITIDLKDIDTASTSLDNCIIYI